PVIVEPVDQGPDRAVFLVLDQGGVVEGPDHLPAPHELGAEKPVVDAEAQSLGGCVQVRSIYEKRQSLVAVKHRAPVVICCIYVLRRGMTRNSSRVPPALIDR